MNEAVVADKVFLHYIHTYLIHSMCERKLTPPLSLLRFLCFLCDALSWNSTDENVFTQLRSIQNIKMNCFVKHVTCLTNTVTVQFMGPSMLTELKQVRSIQWFANVHAPHRSILHRMVYVYSIWNHIREGLLLTPIPSYRASRTAMAWMVLSVSMPNTIPPKPRTWKEYRIFLVRLTRSWWFYTSLHYFCKSDVYLCVNMIFRVRVQTHTYLCCVSNSFIHSSSTAH